jgi:hypothetical protein
MFQISVLSQVADGIGHGLFVAVRDRSARDRWLASLSVMGETPEIPAGGEVGEGGKGVGIGR